MLALGCMAEAADTVTESERSLPVAATADVVVVGASTGAVAAAVAAARAGAAVFVLAPRPYLGEDMAATLRLWLEPGEEPDSELARAIFCPEAHRDHLPQPEVLPFTYRASLPSEGRHLDTDPPQRLADRRCSSAATESVQYNGDVAISADLGKETEIGSVTALVYHRADYRLAAVAISASPDGTNWQPLGNVPCDLAEQSAPESAAEPLRLAFETPVRTRHVRLEFRRAEGSTRILLGEIEFQKPGATIPGGDAGAHAAIRPLHLKQVLDTALIDAKVRFLYASLPTEVLHDGSGRLCGVVVANRAGRQAVLAKVLLDATEGATVARLAGAPFRPFLPGPQEFRRTVIGGGPRPFRGGRVRAIEPALWRQAQPYPVYEYTLTLDVAADDWPAWMAAENQARTLTYDAGQQFAAETLFRVAPVAVVADVSATGPWPGAAALPLGVFQPRGCPRLWLLSGRADLSREAAVGLLRPLALMAVGERLGRALADEAKGLPPPRDPCLRANAAGSPGAAEVREVLDGPRPFLKWERIPAGPRQLPVLGRWDVVVVGGGVSGVPAAIGAARQGVSTLLMEAQYSLGGVGTLGAISTYCHGYRGGFTAEVPGAANWPIEERAEWWRKTAIAAGAEVWFGALGCGALVEQDRVRGVVVATPFGRGVVLAGTVIDATGNADIAAAAGAVCITTDGSELAVQGTGLPPRNLGTSYTNTDFTICDETDMVDVTSLFVYSKHKYRPGTFDQGVLVDTRERRRIVGETTLTILDALAGRHYPDTVLMARTNFDTHGFTVDPFFLLGELPASRRLDCFLPYRCLLPRGLEGILVTGLGVSVHRDAQPLIRMQPDLQNLGYACGVAAAMAKAHGGALRSLDVRPLQRHLVDKGCLPESALEQEDDAPALSPAGLADAVSAAATGGDLGPLLAHGAQALPGLKASYAQAVDPAVRLKYAHILAVLGDGTGAGELVAAVAAHDDWDAGWNFRAMGQFGSDLSPLDSLIVALARTRQAAALAPILRLAAKLDADKDFSHHRATALALEALADPQAAPVLAAVLAKPGMAGHALTGTADAIVAHTQADPSLNALAPRRNSLREIYLARALYRCGDHEGQGERILRAYGQDIRGHFARHAMAVLDQGAAGRR